MHSNALAVQRDAIVGFVLKDLAVASHFHFLTEFRVLSARARVSRGVVFLVFRWRFLIIVGVKGAALSYADSSLTFEMLGDGSLQLPFG